MYSTSVVVLLALAFGANVPLGWWRRYRRRFSPEWFFAIHASIPVLIAMRFALGMSYWIIPAEIVAAVVGQVAGSRLAARSQAAPVAGSRADGRSASGIER
jgi:hypothetical protein